MKKITVIALIAVMAFTLFAGCDRILGKTGNSKTVQSSSEQDPRFVQQPGQGMSEYDAYSYVENIMYPACVAIDYYAGKGMPYSENDRVTEGGIEYARVNSSFANTLEDLERYASNFFGGEFFSNLKDSAKLDSETPKYKDIDGVLYINVSEQYEDSLFTMYTDTFAIVENTESAIKFTMEGDIYGERMLSKIILTNENGGWRITYWNPESLEDESGSAD